MLSVHLLPRRMGCFCACDLIMDCFCPIVRNILDLRIYIHSLTLLQDLLLFSAAMCVTGIISFLHASSMSSHLFTDFNSSVVFGEFQKEQKFPNHKTFDISSPSLILSRSAPVWGVMLSVWWDAFWSPEAQHIICCVRQDWGAKIY